MMKTIAILRHLLLRNILQLRWFLPIPFAIFIAYRAVNGVSYLATTYGTAYNIWDVLFYTQSSEATVYLVLTSLFLYLIADLVFENNYDQWVMLRGGSRRRWWLGKLLTIIVACFIYMSMVIIVMIGVASLSAPWEMDWSEMLKTWHFIEIGLPKFVLTSSPLIIFIQHLVLLMLGWCSFGLLMITVSIITHRQLLGFLAGALVILIGYIGVYFAGNLPATFPFILLIHNHLEFTPGVYPFRVVSVTFSILYWIVWIAVLFTSGYFISKKRDHLTTDMLD